MLDLARRLLFLALIAALLPQGSLAAADRLILRNLDFILDRTVVAFDEDGLRLDAPRAGGSDRLTWDQIERGAIALDQPRFDQLLGELGPPLYRIRQRLKIGDYETLAEPAEQMYSRFADRKSDTAYMVCQAVMWSRLAMGQREAAVEPYFRCLEILRADAAQPADLPGDRRLNVDLRTGLSGDLTPLWFDAAAARTALAAVQETIKGMAQPRLEGVYVYYATLALAAGDSGEVARVLAPLQSDDPQIAAWRSIIALQQDVLSGKPTAATLPLGQQIDALPAACRPAALYWLGLAGVASADERVVRDGLLHLLSLPAEYATSDRELAAAGLYQAAQGLDKLKAERAGAAVRRELASQYAGTFYANKLATER
ncbi:MAG: hypothetical protein WD872_18775 [Pirellulaceae bacterium]